MKVLLVTDIPPCRNFTAGLVLDRLVRFIPSNQLALCTVVDTDLKPDIPEELRHIPTLWLNKPREASVTLRLERLSRKLANYFSFITWITELLQSIRVKYFLLPQIIQFAKQQQVDAIWIVLQGQTIIRIADGLSKSTQLPIFTQVWDPFAWWLRVHRIDAWTQKRLLGQFDEVMRHCRACATASWAMSDYYSQKYGIPNLPVIASLPESYAKQPATAIHAGDDFVIGMAGQLYAEEEWNCLIDALNQVKWTIAGKHIRIRLMGAEFKIKTHYPVNFEYLGWQSQESTINLLSEADLLYLPYWFSKEFYEETSYSFPSKLVTYFASGRPVFCHAPAYASPTQYLKKYEAGYLCESLDSTVVLQHLTQVIVDTEQYRQVAKNGTQCFIRDFTLQRMEAAFSQFLKPC